MSAPQSTKPTQNQEGDVANEGGTAPGGTTAFMSAKGDPKRIDPIVAAHMMHYGAADEAPDGRGNVPIHPGFTPGLFRTARMLSAPDGEMTTPPVNRGSYRP